ncbi:MAG: 3-dehydroquinate synthase [Bacteroidia bacterium]|nr:3-dehydroquinate synthase [Bacteroidia bacterium]
MLPHHIVIEHNPTKAISGFLSKSSYSKMCILMDENTESYCYPSITKFLPPHSILRVKSGEENKNLATTSLIWQQLTEFTMDRHGLLIILGGGVLGDMGGFCAATYKRGIDFLLMPTTLLAQVDASVGGKLGIDFDHFKNHIGLFQEPASTLICTDFLNTLPKRELRSGFAEIIKHCLISDKSMWDTLRNKSFDQQDWKTLVQHSVEYKWSVVTKDPREKGLRKVLNFGHTVGHAVEGYTLKRGNRIFHGEAIAVGMICEAYLAFKKNLLDQEGLDQITEYLIKLFGKVELPQQHDLILSGMLQDKKNKGNKILMALIKGIGKAVWDVEISEEEIKSSLLYYATASY